MSAMAQEGTTSSQRQSAELISGTVVSSTSTTLVVKTVDDQFLLFVFDPHTTKPPTLAKGARVQVDSTAGDEPGARFASRVTLLEPAPKQAGTAASDQAQPIPPAVRNLEHDIEHQARRWRVGVRAGAALDPELILFGVQSQLGPFFKRDVFFRPNAEFAFGEVTDLIALNLEAIYRLPVGSRRSAWAPYVGAGPGFTFLHQSFQRNQVKEGTSIRQL